MSLRPSPARWFELLVAQEDLTAALETLATTGRVELEQRSNGGPIVHVAALDENMETFRRLNLRYRRYWPPPSRALQPTPGQPAVAMLRALGCLRHWESEAAPLVRQLEALYGEQHFLEQWTDLLESFAERPVDFALLCQAGPVLTARVFVLPAAEEPQPPARVPEQVVFSTAVGVEAAYVVAIGAAEDLHHLEHEFGGARGLSVPPWLCDNALDPLELVGSRRAANGRAIRHLELDLDLISKRHGIGDALGELWRLEWFIAHVGELPATENFAWVSGWTSDLDERALQAALGDAGVRGLLHLNTPPEGSRAPMIMRNPPWVRPFELFARLLGTPALTEADPSTLLAVIVPLLFGYMFGDVGQGLVLLLAGVYLGRRRDFMRLLVAAGASSMMFGVLFGSVFAHEDVIPALWVHTLEAPLLILIVPLVAGAVLLVLSQLLNALEAAWRGELRRWALTDAAVLVLYLGLLGVFVLPRAGLLLAGLGIVWYLVGRGFEAEQKRLLNVAAGIPELLEIAMQLLLNTISFTRVGAFALAHAGLSLAVISLSQSSGHPLLGGLITILGNVLILVIEGLVVTVQTTRLVLFEFFIRFLHGEGRSFRPLAAPEQPSSASLGKKATRSPS